MKLHYLYAIVDRLPSRWRPPAAGLGGAPVVPRRVEDVVVLGSPLDTVPPANPRTLALHQDVVATLLDAGATLPFPYGTALPAAALHEWLGAHRDEVRSALATVHGCVEMTVKLLRLDCDRDLQALANSLTERAALRDWRYRASGSAGNMAASVAFLVPRAEVAGFLARIAPIASHAADVAVVPTGPWPPYSFVPELDRAQLARLPSAASHALGRRAG